MIRKLSLSVLTVILAASTVHANWITSWGDGTGSPPNPDYIIDNFTGTIEIRHGDGNEYKFYAETSQGSGVAGVINNITAPNANGDFTVVIQHQNGTEGAQSVNQADLTPNSGTSTLGRIYVKGDLGEDGDIVVDEIIAWQYNWGVDIGGNLVNRIVAPYCDSSVRIAGRGAPPLSAAEGWGTD